MYNVVVAGTAKGLGVYPGPCFKGQPHGLYLSRTFATISY
jgi:hypothetical protein